VAASPWLAARRRRPGSAGVPVDGRAALGDPFEPTRQRRSEPKTDDENRERGDAFSRRPAHGGFAVDRVAPAMGGKRTGGWTGPVERSAARLECGGDEFAALERDR
jgi:hypothetical protein